MSNRKAKKSKFRIYPKGIPLKILWLINYAVTIAFMVMLILVDAFPAKITLSILIIMLLMLGFAQLLISSRHKKKTFRTIGVILSVIFIGVFALGADYLYSTFSVFSRIGADAESTSSGVDLKNDSYNVYFTGIDQWDSEKGKDLERSDVNMIATVNPVTKKILLTSIPRDAYVPLASSGDMDKLTHTGIYGVDETINTVEKWLDIDLNYYVKVNFSGVVDVIDAIGGIEVYSPESFVPEKRDWWTVKKGWNHMNGKEALAFARERHALKEGDASRVLNQQRVVKGIITKMTSSTELLTSYKELLGVADKDVKTNMSSSEMISLAKNEMMDLGGWEIKTQSLKGEYGQETVASLSAANKYSVYKVSQKSIDKCLDNMDKIMNPDKKTVEKELEKRSQKQQKSMMKRFLSKIKKD